MEYGEQITAIIALLLPFWVWFKAVKNNLTESKYKNASYQIRDPDKLFSIISACITFLMSWSYCIYEYGYLFGFGLGWIPSIISAFIVFFLFPYVFQFFKIVFIVAYPFAALSILFEVLSW